MATIELSAALTVNERTRPLLDGRVAPAGIRLIVSPLETAELFWRQLKFAEFDVSEMSLSDLAIAVSRGNRDWWALPVYTLRRFYHTQVLVRRAAGIERPIDLRGRRVGVPEYQLTSVVWVRGVLKEEHGLDWRDLEWFVERRPEQSHGEAIGFVPPTGLRLHYLEPHQNLGDMLLAGEFDALFHYITARNMLDRSRVELRGREEVRTLFPDPAAEGRRYYASKRMYPVNHCVVVKRTVVERYPWVALNVYDAFVAASDEIALTGGAFLHPFVSAGLLDGTVRSALAADPWAYGLRNSYSAVETILRYLCEQELLARPVTVEELFAPSSLTT